MTNKIQSSKEEVEKFLKRLKNIINSNKFKPYRDLEIILKKSSERNR